MLFCVCLHRLPTPLSSAADSPLRFHLDLHVEALLSRTLHHEVSA